MLSFDEWVVELIHLDSVIHELEDRMTYRMLQIGCGEPGSCRHFTKEQEDLADNDTEMKELRYLRRSYMDKRDYLKANGVLPPEDLS